MIYEIKFVEDEMDYNILAELLFPNIDKSPEDYEKIYPKRNLTEGAKVTRLGPSPTGFIHLGNLYGAFVDERLAHQSGGVFYLRTLMISVLSMVQLRLSSILSDSLE